MEADKYFDDALQLFTSLPSFKTDVLLLAGRLVHLNTPSEALRNLFLPALSHLVVDKNNKQPGLTIWYAEGKNLAGKLNAPPWAEFNAQGYNASNENGDVRVFFQPWQKQVFLYSKSKQTGIYWVDTASDVPWWEVTFSFRIIFHFWSYNLPAQLVHAGAIANETTGVLITGPSGSGKSTSCLNLLKAGYKYLGDDYVWIELDETPVVHALYQTAKIEADNLRGKFYDWMPFIKNSQTYNDEKAIFDIKELFPQQWLPCITLKAIVLPAIGKRQYSSFHNAPPSKALLCMAPTTLHHLPHNRDISYKKLSYLSSRIPAYTWMLGYDVQNFQSSFHNFINNA